MYNVSRLSLARSLVVAVVASEIAFELSERFVKQSLTPPGVPSKEPSGVCDADGLAFLGPASSDVSIFKKTRIVAAMTRDLNIYPETLISS